ncbi:hypothetical protein AXJ18_gp226 [Streptomyces phage Jay2Jay]|uniref:LamG-like jellyroll fold domain-containing protein n=1 Tax=Streptomyces phage Jay2Jay TaxID=1556290 RepID=A0A0A0RL57_9CAUD|nr:hypothetical protein AXJ18_gp226 [Streptomyces phage Jay2Jay]AIW02548.1 hypothetical protein PBI_JAY2JAY_50 [Streptomyces phage Jay2Jay]
MSYQLQVLTDAPFSYWKLDETGPAFPDSAGSMRTADLVGTITRHPALVTGSGNALVLDNTNHLDMDDPVFNKGYELRQFSLEAWVKPVKITGEVSVMSHSGIYDGLTITPTHIYFSTKYLTAGSCEVSYEYSTGKSFHVVGVHTNAKNSLYVDGVLVAETDLTDEQQIDSYSFLTSDLIAGQGSGTIALDAPAVYTDALGAEAISRHYFNGVDVDTSEAIAGFNDAIFWNFTDETRNIAIKKVWASDDDWSDAVLTDVAVIDGTIVPSYSQTETEVVEDGLIVPVYENTSLPGVWLASLSFTSIPEETITDARINWVGEGSYTIEYSVDGGNIWLEPSDSGATVLDNESVIDIRVTFDGGIVDDESFVSSIEVVGYLDKYYRGSRADRTAQMSGTGVVSSSYFEPIEYADVNGLRIITGTVNVSLDDSYEGEQEAGDLNVNGIDMWIKPTVGNILTATGISISRVGNTIVFSGFSSFTVNGNSVTSGDTVFDSDSWYHIAGVFSTPGNYAMSIASAGTIISQLSVIYGSLSLLGLQQIYAAYLGLPGLIVNDTSTVDIGEGSPATNLYAHVWGITPAG